MRDVLHAIATALVIAIAAVCTMAQVADVQHAFDRLQHDESSVQQVDSGHAGRPGGQDAGRTAGQDNPRHVGQK